MKKKIFLFFITALFSLGASAVTIWVNGTKITGTTGFSIGSGTVNYNADTKTLSLNNVSFERSGSGNEGIYNVDVSGLTIKFTGTNSITIANASCLVLGATTTVNVASGTTTFKCTASDQNAIGLYTCDVTLSGSGTLKLVSTNGTAIQGRSGSTSCNTTFSIKNCEITTERHSFYNLNKVTFNSGSSFGSDDYSSSVTLKAHSNNSYAHIKDVSALSRANNVFVWSPIFGLDMTNLYNKNFATEEIIIRDADIVAFINSDNFPDENFRNFLNNYFSPRGFIMRSEINSITTLNLSQKNISSLIGIRYFTALRKLWCDNNNLSSLDLSGLNNLIMIVCEKNNIKGNDMTNFINSLVGYSSGSSTGTLYVAECCKSEKNIITSTQAASAEAKGWKVCVTDEGQTRDYEGVFGDVNGDDVCNAADVTALYNWILNGNSSELRHADQNHDYVINAADVTKVYNIILGVLPE